MVRIAHIADTHLSFRQYNLDERERDLYDVMDEIAERILEERADIIIHSGDLFDSPRPPAQAYYAFKSFLAKTSGRARFFSVLGDHDTPKRRGMPPQKLFDDKIHVLGLTGGSHQVLQVNGRDILVAGVSHISRRYREMLTEELKKLDAVAANYPISVIALHQAIDRFFPFEDASELRLDDLPRNFKYYAMGHLHNRMRASFGRGELAYPGSTEIMRSDEISDWERRGKGFYIIDLDGGDLDIREVNLERIRPQLEFKIKYDAFELELKRLIDSLKVYSGRKPPIAHVIVEGKEIDRQKVQQSLNKALMGKVLYFRSRVIEEPERDLVDLKPGDINIGLLLREYLRDEKVAEFGYELFKVLKDGDVEEAKRIADEYFKRMMKIDFEKSAS
ncbi:MAG: exonuclease SbcCD subunit D [Candidatus Bathyarchaeia archaeon]